jgi:pyruvate kinase
MDRIVRYTEDAVYRDRFHLDRQGTDQLSHDTGSYGRALAEAAVFAAKEAEAQAILVFSQSGMMAQHVAALRPRQEIIAFTPAIETYWRLAATWGTRSYLLETTGLSDALLTQADRMVMDLKLAEIGDTIVMVAGQISGMSLSNMVKLHRVGELSQMNADKF